MDSRLAYRPELDGHLIRTASVLELPIGIGENDGPGPTTAGDGPGVSVGGAPVAGGIIASEAVFRVRQGSGTDGLSGGIIASGAVTRGGEGYGRLCAIAGRWRRGDGTAEAPAQAASSISPQAARMRSGGAPISALGPSGLLGMVCALRLLASFGINVAYINRCSALLFSLSPQYQPLAFDRLAEAHRYIFNPLPQFEVVAVAVAQYVARLAGGVDEARCIQIAEINAV